jgi:hypothetical protein
MIVGHMPPPATRRERDHDMAALRRVMGTDAFEHAYGEGQAMTLERAVEYALASLGPQASTGGATARETHRR